MASNILLGKLLGIPSHIHKQLDGIFHGLQVTDIQYPHALDTVVIGQRQLFEHLLSLSDIKPLRITGCTYIIHMVIQTPATRMFTFFGIGYTAHITPVVITQQNKHIVGHTHAGIIVVKHLFIQRPHLCRLISRFLGDVLDNLTLVLHNGLQQFGISLSTHCFVTVATHTDGDHILSILHALNTLTEELVQLLLVLLVVPRAPLATLAGIFLVITGHRLMVRGTHDDTHLICGLRVFRIVSIERPTPHGRPQHVTLQTQDEFKDLGIEAVVAIVRTKGILHP